MKKQATIKEARKILGDDANEMSDDQVQELMDHLVAVARSYLEDVRNRKEQAVPE